MFRPLITIKTLSSGFLNKLKGWIRFPEVCEPLFVHLGQVWSPNGPIYVFRLVLLWVEEICLNFLFSSPTQGVWITVNCSHEPQHTSTAGSPTAGLLVQTGLKGFATRRRSFMFLYLWFPTLCYWSFMINWRLLRWAMSWLLSTFEMTLHWCILQLKPIWNTWYLKGRF